MPKHDGRFRFEHRVELVMQPQLRKRSMENQFATRLIICQLTLNLATGHDTTPEALMACFSQNAICRFPSRVLRVDPITLDSEVIIAYNPDVYGIGTVAVQVNDEVWVGSARCSGIARFR